MLSYRKFLIWIFIAVGLALGQVVWSEFWPRPFNYINIVFASLTVWLLFTRDKIKFFQTVFIIYWLFEILSSAPYGINLVSAFLSFILLERLSARVFTGHSIQTAMLLSAVGLLALRICYLLISLAVGFLNTGHLALSGALLGAIFWEIILTMAATGIIFMAAIFGIRRFNPRYVLMNNKILYG